MIALILAIGRGGAIGRGNKLPWHFPEDLAHFKALTKGHTVVMGWNTHAGIGMALPGRRNIIVTSTGREVVPGCEVSPDLDTAIHMAQRGALSNPLADTFLIGGVRIFEDGLALADRIYITEVDAPCGLADVFFRLDTTGFTETARRPGVTPVLSFVTYQRQ